MRQAVSDRPLRKKPKATPANNGPPSPPIFFLFSSLPTLSVNLFHDTTYHLVPTLVSRSALPLAKSCDTSFISSSANYPHRARSLNNPLRSHPTPRSQRQVACDPPHLTNRQHVERQGPRGSSRGYVSDSTPSKHCLETLARSGCVRLGGDGRRQKRQDSGLTSLGALCRTNRVELR